MESIFDVFYLLFPKFASQGDNVKPYVEINAMIAYVSIGSLYNLVDLLVGYCIYGITETIILACFYLNDGNSIILLRYDVEFLVPKSPVTVAYCISSCHEVGNRTIFTDSTKFVMLRHEINELLVCKNSASQAKKQIKAEKRI